MITGIISNKHRPQANRKTAFAGAVKVKVTSSKSF